MSTLLAGLPPSAALIAPDGAEVTGQAIAGLAAGVSSLLDVPPGSTVAVGLPLGVPAALSLLGVSARHVALPLSPDAPIRRLSHDLADTSAVITTRGLSPLRSAAEARDLPIVELPALSTWPTGSTAPTVADPGRPAVRLQSSGTTGRPHLATISHANLLASAASVVEALQLTEADRSLALMPLFHSHGLVVSLIAPLLSGGTVIFAPEPVLSLVAEHRPTWWSAAPAIHQALLRQHRSTPLPTGSLRALRVGSAALTPALRDQLTRSFGVPVIEAYGLTETAGPVASELLGVAKAGMTPQRSVTVSVRSDSGVRSSVGEGELLLRGPAVADLVDEAGWFATGDLACIHADGSVSLTARRHDIINRGGESINPAHVEAVLAGHPGVAQAAAFALPHPTLGETVGAAVVLQPDSATTGEELVAYAGTHLSFAESPRSVAILSSLPTGPTGKVDRAALASLSLAAGSSCAEPSVLAAEIQPLMAAALDRDAVGVDEDFFAAGGDSLSAIWFITEIETRWHVILDMQHIVREPLTCRSLASRIAGETAGARAGSDAPRIEQITLNPQGTLPPLFLVFTGVASLLSARGIAGRLGDDRPVIGLVPEQRSGLLDTSSSIRAISSQLVPLLLAAAPTGPILLAGHSFGGRVAHELACQLLARGRKVSLVVLIDTRTSGHLRLEVVRRAPTLVNWADSSAGASIRAVTRRVGRGRLPLDGPAPADPSAPRRTFDDVGARLLAFKHRESPLPMDLHLLSAAENTRPALGWRGGHRHSGGRVLGRVQVHVIPGTHSTMLQEPNLAELVRVLAALLAEAGASEHDS